MTAWQCRRMQPQLVDLAEGALPPSDEARVRSHVAACDDCAAALAALDEIPVMLRELPAPGRDEEFWRRQRQSIARRVRHVEPGRAPAASRGIAWGVGIAAAAVLALTLATQRPAAPPLALERTAAVEGLEADDVIDVAELAEAWNGELDALHESGLPDDFLVAEDVTWSAPDRDVDEPGAAFRDLDDQDLEHLEEMTG